MRPLEWIAIAELPALLLAAIAAWRLGVRVRRMGRELRELRMWARDERAGRAGLVRDALTLADAPMARGTES